MSKISSPSRNATWTSWCNSNNCATVTPRSSVFARLLPLALTFFAYASLSLFSASSGIHFTSAPSAAASRPAWCNSEAPRLATAAGDPDLRPWPKSVCRRWRPAAGDPDLRTGCISGARPCAAAAGDSNLRVECDSEARPRAPATGEPTLGGWPCSGKPRNGLSSSHRSLPCLRAVFELLPFAPLRIVRFVSCNAVASRS
mmetsp:Transcript_8436/g.21647  ORF Transcript_8436/g.21647 Transcript_8436/m.21647 type:complete len:200 (-) Transcript_8436:650-1249(-)